MKRSLDCLNQLLSHGFVLPFTWTNRYRFTDWANGNQNSILVNFVPESRLPFAQIEIQPVKDGNTNSRLEHSDHKNSVP